MRTTFLNLILLFVIVGCKQPTINKVQQAVEAQAKLLVDSGLIANEYVVLYELAINDSNHIYSIQAADCPADLKWFFVKFGGNLFFISTVFFFLNPIKSCRYVCFLVTLKTPHH